MGTATKEVRPVAAVHAALWRARDTVTELEVRLATEDEARAEATAAAMIAGDVLVCTDGDAAERRAAELDAVRRVVTILSAQHVASLQAELDADHAAALLRRDDALALKAELEGQLGPLLARMDEIKVEVLAIMPLIVPTVPRSMTARTLTGTATELRAKLRDDPRCTLLPSELDRALEDVAAQEKAQRVAYHSQGTVGKHRGAQPSAGRITIHFNGVTGCLTQGPHGTSAVTVLTWGHDG
jgi:hypothetical protein